MTTLGLRHNFKGSASYSAAELSNRSFTSSHGMGSSVMDYNPVFLPSNRSLQGDYYSAVIGEYDRWAAGDRCGGDGGDGVRTGDGRRGVGGERRPGEKA